MTDCERHVPAGAAAVVAAVPSAIGPAQSAPAAAPDLGQTRVLLVEDNPGDVELIEEALLEVSPESGDPPILLERVDRLTPAIDRLRSNTQPAIDAVLLDLSLPDSQGFATFQRAYRAAAHVPFIILSGLDDRALTARAVREGAQDYLVKGSADGPLLVRSIRYAIARKRAETEREQLVREQLARARAEEEQRRLTQLVEENASLNRQLKEALRTRDAFLASVAHDLKTPLAGIKGYSQLLQRQLARHSTALRQNPSAEALQGMTDQALERVHNINHAVDRMTRMVDELLDLARLQTGQPLALHQRRTDLIALVRQLAADHQQASGRHHIEVRAQVPNLIGAWDAARLERVIDNLLSNALKYSPAGGDVVLEAAREDAGDRGWAILTVSDQGMGIPAAELPQVFDRFRRGSNVADKVRGTGIGLASVRQIVELHGGTVGVESQEGAGSRFIVRLPLQPPAAPPSAEA